MSRRTLAFPAAVLFAAGFLLVPTGLQGQEEEADDPPALPEADSVQLVFEREIFTYPSYERRNPFRPLTGPDDAGPRFEDLIFMGAIVTDDPAASVALLGVRGGRADEADGPTHRLRRGQRIGNVRIVEVRSRELVVEVEEFGLTERRTMELRRTEPRPRADSADVEDSPPEQGDTITPPPDTVPRADGPRRGDPAAGIPGADTRDPAGMNGNGGT